LVSAFIDPEVDDDGHDEASHDSCQEDGGGCQTCSVAPWMMMPWFKESSPGSRLVA